MLLFRQIEGKDELRRGEADFGMLLSDDQGDPRPAQARLEGEGGESGRVFLAWRSSTHERRQE